MEEIGGSLFNGHKNSVKKKRSQTSRRPRLDSQPCLECPFLADDLSKVSSDENAGYAHSCKRKECDLHHSSSFISFDGSVEVENSHEKTNKNGHRSSSDNNKHSSEVVIYSANFRSLSKVNDGREFESSSYADDSGGHKGECMTSGNSGLCIDKLGKNKKVMLKFGGIMKRIEAFSTSNDSPGANLSFTGPLSSEAAKMQQKKIFEANLDDNYQSDKKHGLQLVAWKDFSRSGFSIGREDIHRGKMYEFHGKNVSGKQDDKSEPVRKRKRVLKKHMMDEQFGDDDEDDEALYLEKLKTSMAAPGCIEDDEGSIKKHRKLSSISNMDNVGVSRSRNDVKKSKSVSEDTEFEEEIGLSSDGDLGDRNKKQRKASVELIDGKREMNLTRRQRALQLSKDASSVQSATLIEFPDGLPPAPSRKQKEKLSDVDLQLKKAEAAQKRKLQVEKAARESEAEAIRKILGQGSKRKKLEDKIEKRREELVQEKAAQAMRLASSTVRWVMGSSGTVVTFPKDMGLPAIFDCKPCSYPPPRDNCVGPSCSNPYKYRDSNSKLPLCSLHCYRAIQEKFAQTTY